MKTISLTTKGLLAILLMGALTFTSCKKENSTDTQQEIVVTLDAAQNDAEAENQFNDVFDNVTATNGGDNLGLVDGAGIYGREDSVGRCFTVTVSPDTPGVFPKTVTIDFGTGCLGKDGKLRTGKIMIVFTGRLAEPGKSATTTFVNYTVNGVKIEGTHVITNTSTSNNRSFTVEVTNAKITKQDGKWVKWSSAKSFVQTEGNGTPRFHEDDVIVITGNKNGENSEGATWSATIIDQLVRKGNCRWIVSGKVNLVRKGVTALLDYGNGDCDNKATITINGVTREITL
ncbi:MAG TPA: hypothetical protein VFN30_03140 [Chitinophagaceae bacterium]|nr:hypothetical protein [Chitinophagaceae bacterium]